MGLYPRQNARAYPWQGDNIARSGLNWVATLLLFSGLMRVWIFYIFSHFNLLYLNLLNYSSYSDIRAYSACSRAQICELCSALCWGASQRGYPVCMLSAAGEIKHQSRIIGKSLCCMGLESEIQTLVETLVQGKSEGSLETLADTNFWDSGETLQIQKLRLSLD